MSILDTFTETQNSNNRFRGHSSKEDEIIVGGTVTHVFILPFKYSEYVVDGKLLYKQGITTILEKDSSSFVLEEKGNKTTILTVKLSPEETSLFDRFLLDTYVQLKIYTVNQEVLYNKLNKLKVIMPISDIAN